MTAVHLSFFIFVFNFGHKPIDLNEKIFDSYACSFVPQFIYD